jgi:hypothetical protein
MFCNLFVKPASLRFLTWKTGPIPCVFMVSECHKGSKGFGHEVQPRGAGSYRTRRTAFSNMPCPEGAKGLSPEGFNPGFRFQKGAPCLSAVVVGNRDEGGKGR